jgi:hypothetical protein
MACSKNVGEQFAEKREMAMRSKILLTIFSLCLAHGLPVRAADTTQMEKLGAIRLRVCAKFNDVQKLMNDAANGANQADNSLQFQYQQSSAIWNRRIQQENAKPADTRDQALVESLNAKIDKANTMWSNHQWAEGPIYLQQMAPLRDTLSYLVLLIQALSPIDQSWVRADLDAPQLTAVFANIEKRLDEISTAATTIVENYKKADAANEHALLD